jgi:hypothetical protein
MLITVVNFEQTASFWLLRVYDLNSFSRDFVHSVDRALGFNRTGSSV